MRVKILSGNAAGGIQDVPPVEAEVLIATGFAELVADDPAAAAASPEPAPNTPAPAPKTSRRGFLK